MIKNTTSEGRLVGKTVLITAAGQGMGRATALAMEKEGATVYATDINKQLLAKLKEENTNLNVLKLDAMDAEAISEMPKLTGTITTLFNCAGHVHNGTILDTTDDDFDFSFNLNVRSQFRLIKAYLPIMIASGGGSIINMASVASTIKGAPNRCLYGATKAAVMGMTRAVAMDFVDKGIRCNAICPGTIYTPSLEDRMRALGNLEQAKKAFLARQPIGRFASAEEVTGVIIHLASDESKFTTGTFQIVDGGWSL